MPHSRTVFATEDSTAVEGNINGTSGDLDNTYASRMSLEAHAQEARCDRLRTDVSLLAALHDDGDGSGPRFNTQSLVEMLYVFLNGPRTDAEDLSNVWIGLAFGDPRQDFGLAIGQPEGSQRFH